MARDIWVMESGCGCGCEWGHVVGGIFRGNVRWVWRASS